MMKVGFSPVSFKADDNIIMQNNNMKKAEDKPVTEGVSKAENDSFTNSAQNVPGQKSGKSFNESVANFWKFFSVANQMANAALKGLFYGALTGVSLLTGSWLFKSLPKAFSKEGPSLWQTLRHPINNISKTGKVVAGVGSGLVLAYHLIKGKLDANQNTAVIDHKLKVGHRTV